MVFPTFKDICNINAVMEDLHLRESGEARRRGLCSFTYLRLVSSAFRLKAANKGSLPWSRKACMLFRTRFSASEIK